MFMRVSNRIRIKVSKTFETFWGKHTLYWCSKRSLDIDFIYFFGGGGVKIHYISEMVKYVIPHVP